MKKILLIIAIALCIFQMVVLATVINIGSPATDRTSAGGRNTMVSKYVPADGTGKITTVEFYVNAALAGCQVATFYVVSGNNLSTRDYETIQIAGQAAGVVPTGYQTATVDLDVVAGDYIGICWTNSDGYIDKDSTVGAGTWYRGYDSGIPCTDAAFTLVANYMISLCGTGATVEAEEANAIFFGMNF